jgi:exodeoxyribonuclease-1
VKPISFPLYDTETTGLSKAHDQILQFAGFKVDQDLNIIPGSELVVDVRPRPDVVPGPYAFAIHGISIESLLKNGVTEWEAAGKIRDWFMDGGPSMMTGFNSQGFDDEMIRNLFYRTMIDPYEHEWKNGNSRGDVMRLIMLAFALRPETLRWPINPSDGRFTLKLGKLCEENGITLDHAHDARFDVIATLDLMRLVKKNNPKLFDYFLTLSDKNNVSNMVMSRKPLAVVNSFFPREQGHLSIMLPVIMDSVQSKTKMWCVDLREDPTELLSLPASEINRRMFTKLNELGEGEGISSIREISINKQPLICNLNIFNGRQDVAQRAGLDIERCLKHAAMIEADPDFRARLQAAMVNDFPPCEDVYEGIYSLGMFGRDEQGLRSSMRRLVEVSGIEGLHPKILGTDPHQLATLSARDRLRAFELTLRAKWSNHGDKVIAMNQFTKEELSEWVKHLENAWFKETPGKNARNYEGYKAELAEVKASLAMNPEQEKAIKEMEAFVEQNLAMIESLKELCAEMHAQAIETSTPDRSEVGMIEADRKNREARHNVTGMDYQI